MASLTKMEWIILIPDVEGALERRMQIRDLHIKNVAKHVESGLLQMGGATLHSPAQGGELDIHGSAIIGRADTLDEILDVLKQDIYYTSGIWDWEKKQIYPFKCVYRKGME